MILFGHGRITKDVSGLDLEELKALLVQALEEVARLKAENAELREEIARLKGLKGLPRSSRAAWRRRRKPLPKEAGGKSGAGPSVRSLPLTRRGSSSPRPFQRMRASRGMRILSSRTLL